MKIKPFQIFLYHNNAKMPPELAMVLFGRETRAIGITFQREYMVARLGILNTVRIWLWKWYRDFRWITYDK